MIRKFKEYIKLDTPNTTLLFRVRKEYTEVLYYGHRLPDAEDYDVFGKNLYLGTVGCEDYVTARLPVSFTGIGIVDWMPFRMQGKATLLGYKFFRAKLKCS